MVGEYGGKAVVPGSERCVVRVSERKDTWCSRVVVKKYWTKTKRLSYLSPLDSPCIRRFFLNLSDVFSFALLSSDAVSLCLRFRPRARSRLDCSYSISVSHNLFTHRSPRGGTSTTWLVVWGRDHRSCAHAIKVWRIYIQTWTDNTARLVASR